MIRLMLGLLSIFWVHIAHAASFTLADERYVAEAIARNAIIWDVRPADAYAAGHIAGAVNIGDAPRVLRDENTEDFIPTDRIEKILGAAGLDPKREIIVYGTRGSWMPYFGLYTIKYFGGNNVRVYHDGIEGWTSAGREASREAPTKVPVALKLEIDPNVAVTTKEVMARRLYARFDPGRETIVYCQSGSRASETAGVLQELGFTNVKVYDSSWLGYGNTLDAPADNVTFFNVGLLTSRLSTLQDRVNQLEKELAETKARR